MSDLRLALRAFLWRRGGSLVVLVVGALTVAAAAIGPLYAAAAAESVLQDRLTQANAGRTTIAFRTQSDVSYPGSIDVVASAQAQSGSVPGYGPLVDEALVPTSVSAAGGLEALTQVVWRDGACDHLVLVEGRCARGVGEAIVSGRSAEAMGWRLGTRLTFTQLRQYDTSVPRAVAVTDPARVTVVGTYRPKSTVDPFWAGRVYFSFHPSPGAADGPDTVDTVFVDRGLFATLQNPTIGAVGADLLLTHPSAIRVADVPQVRADVESYLGPQTTGPSPQTGMLGVLDDFERERGQTALAAAVVSAQLALLALLLLYLVILDTSEARGGEVALAKLRGLRPSAVMAVALREPVVLLVAAVPLGLALAYAGTRVLAHALFVADVPVEVDRATWVAVGVAFLGGLAAAVVASRRMFTRPVLDQWTSSERPRRPRWGLAADVLLAVVALGGFAALGESSSSPDEGSSLARGLGWAAPSLLVVALALIGVRLFGPLLSSLVRRTRASSQVGLFLAVRQAVRRPSGLRLAGLLAVTLGLATFAVDAEAAAAASRSVRAGAEVGATTTVAVQPSGVDLQAAVRAADPDGRWAMAVADWIPDGGSIAGRVLAVDSARLAAVAFWSPDYGAGSAAAVASAISPVLPSPVPLAGDTVRVRITSGPVAAPAPTVLIGVRDVHGRAVTAVSTPLVAGTHDYDAALPCPGTGCVFYGVAVDRSQATAPAHLDLLVTAVSAGTGGRWVPAHPPLDRPADWTVGSYTGGPVGRVTATSAGLRYTGDAPAFASPFVHYADAPVPLPMITTPRSTGPTTDAGPSFTDGSGRTTAVRSVATAGVLPLVGDSGVMVDLTSLRRAAQQLEDEAHWSVWLGPRAPSDALARLTAAGLQIDAVTTAAEREQQLAREGPALALRLLLVCALVGAVLAAGALAISVAVTGRRRSYELAALRAVAVSRWSLVRACVLEQGLLLGVGLVVGVPTGIAVARLALPSIPQSASTTPLPPTLDVQVLAVSSFVVVTAALLVTTSIVGGLALVRQAVPGLLREVAP